MGGLARWGLALLAAASLATPAMAGPPYLTDDAEPTDPGHWEIYNFVTATETPGDFAGEGGLDLNYGAAKDLQLTAVIPAGFDNGDVGAGVIELAAKYKFLHQSQGGWMPDVAFFPRIFAPTGARFDAVRPGLFLPLWAEKDWGPWSLFGGGGLQINPGAGQRNFWQTGVALSRSFGDRVSVGAEVFHQTATARDGRDFTAVDVGATYKLSPHWTLMGSLGPGVQNAREEGQYTFYAALEATY
jgi:hypothetical protein